MLKRVLPGLKGRLVSWARNRVESELKRLISERIRNELRDAEVQSFCEEVLSEAAEENPPPFLPRNGIESVKRVK